MSFSLYTVIAEAMSKKKPISCEMGSQSLLMQCTGKTLGARVALLQSPIPPQPQCHFNNEA